MNNDSARRNSSPKAALGSPGSTRRSNLSDIEIAGRLRQSRMASGVTQAGLADILGVTFQQVQKYESGTNRISAGRLVDLAEAVGVDVGYLVTGGTTTKGVTFSDEDYSLFYQFKRLPSKQRQAIANLILAIAEAS